MSTDKAGTSNVVSGRPLREQAREIIYNVAEYMKMKNESGERLNYVDQCSAAVKVATSTVKRVLIEGTALFLFQDRNFNMLESTQVPQVPKKRDASTQVPEIDPPNQGTNWKNVAIATGVVTTGAVVAPLAVVGILGAAGFGAGGVVAGSVAAGIQSAVYGGATGGAFAVCQSIGAAGLGAAGVTTSAVGGGGIAGGVYAGINKLFRKKNGRDSGNNDSSSGSSVKAASKPEPQNANGNVKTLPNRGQCDKSTQTE